MTNLMTIANDLNMLVTDLDRATIDMVEADAHATEAEHNYRVAYAKAFLEAQGTVQQKEQTTILATEPERWDMEVARQILRASKAQMDAVRTRIDVGRSLSAMTRSEMALGGFIA